MFDGFRVPEAYNGSAANKYYCRGHDNCTGNAGLDWPWQDAFLHYLGNFGQNVYGLGLRSFRFMF